MSLVKVHLFILDWTENGHGIYYKKPTEKQIEKFDIVYIYEYGGYNDSMVIVATDQLFAIAKITATHNTGK